MARRYPLHSIEKEKTVSENSCASQDQQLKELFFSDAQCRFIFHQHERYHEDKRKHIAEGGPSKRLENLRCHSGGDESTAPHDRYKNQLDVNHCAKVGFFISPQQSIIAFTTLFKGSESCGNPVNTSSNKRRWVIMGNGSI